MLFRSKLLDIYRENFAKLFTPTTIQYLYASNENDLIALHDQYVRDFINGGVIKSASLIAGIQVSLTISACETTFASMDAARTLISCLNGYPRIHRS